MGYNPFGAVTSYKEMLAKIAVFTFGNAILAAALLNVAVPGIGQVLSRWAIPIPVEGVSIPLGVLAVAFVWAVAMRLVKLHDRVSDALRLRERFDFEHVLKPLAGAVGVALTRQRELAIKGARRQLMRDVFYRYASGGSGRAVIDEHYISLALDQWAWFWIVIEGMVTWMTAGVILAASAQFLTAVIVVACVLCSSLLPVLSWRASVRYAQDEIQQIVQDQARREEITKSFNALPC